MQKIRPEVPAPVIAVVQRLMSKKPEDRFQTPADLAAALAVLAGRNNQSSQGIPIVATVGGRPSAPMLALPKIPTAAPVSRSSAPTDGSVPVAEVAGTAKPGSHPEMPVIDRAVSADSRRLARIGHIGS